MRHFGDIFLSVFHWIQFSMKDDVITIFDVRTGGQLDERKYEVEVRCQKMFNEDYSLKKCAE